MEHTTGRSEEELRNLALLKVQNIGVDFETADEAWESLANAVGDDPNFAVADRAFAEATGTLDSYIEEV